MAPARTRLRAGTILITVEGVEQLEHLARNLP
jgi:hypothetical protein